MMEQAFVVRRLDWHCIPRQLAAREPANSRAAIFGILPDGQAIKRGYYLALIALTIEVIMFTGAVPVTAATFSCVAWLWI